MNVSRYINRDEVKFVDLKRYELDNTLILRTIKAVNERLSDGVDGVQEIVVG